MLTFEEADGLTSNAVALPPTSKPCSGDGPMRVGAVVALIGMSLSLQGCTGFVHTTAKWRMEAKYKKDFSFIPPGVPLFRTQKDTQRNSTQSL
eukprot:2982920-Amphidinium_carterae.1